jgi:hypothetical protein
MFLALAAAAALFVVCSEKLSRRPENWIRAAYSLMIIDLVVLER